MLLGKPPMHLLILLVYVMNCLQISGIYLRQGASLSLIYFLKRALTSASVGIDATLPALEIAIAAAALA